MVRLSHTIVSVLDIEHPHAVTHRLLCSTLEDVSNGWNPLHSHTHTHPMTHYLCGKDHTRSGSQILHPLFLSLSRCPVWSDWPHGFRPSCSGCSLRSSWTTLSPMWFQWQQHARSSGRARHSPSCCSSSFLSEITWTLVHATEKHSASPCHTCARCEMRLDILHSHTETQTEHLE